MSPLEVLSALSSIATAIGVAVAAYQLFITRRQATTTFEDTLNTQYRQAIERLPIEALFGEPLKETEQSGLLPHFYRYFDLCNEQAFLFSLGRVSETTWKNWEEGIKGNMVRPAFKVAWNEVARRATGDFESLRKLCPPQVTAAQAQ
jgi:hypothetical protein